MIIIKKWFNELIFKLGIFRKKRKPSILKEAIDHPENMKLEAHIEGEEIIIKIKRKTDT